QLTELGPPGLGFTRSDRNLADFDNLGRREASANAHDARWVELRGPVQDQRASLAGRLDDFDVFSLSLANAQGYADLFGNGERSRLIRHQADRQWRRGLNRFFLWLGRHAGDADADRIGDEHH